MTTDEVFDSVICVGDLHGQLEKTKQLWSSLERELGQNRVANSAVVFLGDYCDRGPDSCGVLEWLIQLCQTRRPGSTFCIAGNHDHAMGAFLGCEPAAEYPADFDFDSTKASEKDGSVYWEHDTQMHFQGRRWANPYGEEYQRSHLTWKSYGSICIVSLMVGTSIIGLLCIDLLNDRLGK